jgi:hypothetical protein
MQQGQTGPDYQKKGRGHFTKTGPKSETCFGATTTKGTPLPIFFSAAGKI